MNGIYKFVARCGRSLVRRLGLRRPLSLAREAIAVRVAASRERAEEMERQSREDALERARLKRIPGLSSIDSKKPVLIFFTPVSGIHSFYATHSVVARTMKALGHQVLLVR